MSEATRTYGNDAPATECGQPTGCKHPYCLCPRKPKPKRLDLRTLEIQQNLCRRFTDRIETLLYEGRSDPGLVGAAMAEASCEELVGLCEEILEDGGEGWTW